jgi:phage baseplate assembly protein V
MSAELERLMSNMIRIGVVAELDEANARVKMRVNGLVTDWMPFNTGRAGATRTWSAPRPGEQLVVFAPYGDTGQAFAAQSVYQDAHPPPATSQDQEHTIFPDGSTLDYNSANNTYTLTVVGQGNVIVNCKKMTVNATESVTLNTPDTFCKGRLTVDDLLTWKNKSQGSNGLFINGVGCIVSNGDHVADGWSLKTHPHMEQGDGMKTSPALPG